MKHTKLIPPCNSAPLLQLQSTSPNIYLTNWGPPNQKQVYSILSLFGKSDILKFRVNNQLFNTVQPLPYLQRIDIYCKHPHQSPYAIYRKTRNHIHGCSNFTLFRLPSPAKDENQLNEVQKFKELLKSFSTCQILLDITCNKNTIQNSPSEARKLTSCNNV